MSCMMPRKKRSKKYIQPTHMEQCYIKSKIYNYFDIVHSVQYNMMCKYTALLTQYKQVKGNEFKTYLSIKIYYINYCLLHTRCTKQIKNV
jgi:hypothetical protein